MVDDALAARGKRDAEKEQELLDEEVELEEEKVEAIKKEVAAERSRAGRAWDFAKRRGRNIRSGGTKAGRGIGKGAVAVGGAGVGLMTGLAMRSKRSYPAALKEKPYKPSIKERFQGKIPDSVKVLFFFAVIIHAIYAYVFYKNLFPAYRIPLAAAYALLLLYAIIVFSKLDGFVDMGKAGWMFGIILAYFFVPFGLGYVPDLTISGNFTLLGLLEGIIVFFPFFIFVICKRGELPYFNWYITIWIGILLVVLFLNVIFETPQYQIGTVDGERAGEIITFLADEIREMGTKIWGSILNLPPKIINATGINYYTGMVDDNKEAPVGLRLDNARVIDQYFYEGSPATVWADIEGKSFVDRIDVTPSCYIPKVGDGMPDPRMFSIYGFERDSLTCTFYNLTKGSYLARVAATFNFETWAYVTYTFVDVETRRSLEIQGKNVNYELDVNPTLKSVFSNGPVMLGMSAQVDQPVGIDTEYNSREPIMGVTLDNLWAGSGNEVERVDEFIIIVPDDIQLVKCDRWRPDTERDPYQSQDGLDYYRFTREEIGDPRLTFQSVTCRLRIREPRSFLAGKQKVQRTFVAMAKYMYKLEKGVRIYVKE